MAEITLDKSEFHIDNDDHSSEYVSLYMIRSNAKEAEKTINQILDNQAFRNDVLKDYIKFLEIQKEHKEKTRDIEDIITDIKQIESGDFFGEE